MVEQVNVIEAVGLSKTLLGQQILRDVCLRIAEAECVAITGENGSGKTTLLRCLAGALRPDQGSLTWYGHPTGATAGMRRLVGFVAHESQVYAQLTVYENLVFAARMNNVPQPGRRVEQLLAEFGMTYYAKQLPNRISRGQRQRLTIARAIVHDPRLLLLDEPFTGLDGPGRAWLLQLLTQFRDRGRTLCLTTHDADILQPLAPRFVSLRDGELYACAADTIAWGHAAA